MTTERVVHVAELEGKTKEELISVAQEVGLEDGTPLAGLRREEILHRIMQAFSDQQGLMASGILELMAEGYGFLRQNGLRPAAGMYTSPNLRSDGSP